MSQQQIYNFFTYTCDAPKLFGTVHILVLLATILLTFILSKLFINASAKTERLVLLGAWIILLLMETYRQISYSIYMNGDMIEWSYNWGQMSLQVCSVQLYCLPFIILLKDGKLRDAFICVMMVWSLIGGLGVTVYPGETLVTTLGITIQSMAHHSIQVILGVALTFRYAKRMSKKHFLGGFILFTIYFFIAMCANIHVHDYILVHKGGTINMFMLSPYGDPLIDILKKIRELTNHWTMTFVYMTCFNLLAVVLYFIELRMTKSLRGAQKI